MNDPLVHQQNLLDQLHRHIAERVTVEKRLRAEYESNLVAAEQEYTEASQALNERFRRETTETQHAYDAQRSAIESQFASLQEATQAELDEALRTIENRHQTEIAASHQQHKEATWEATAVYDAAEKRIKQELGLLKKQRRKVDQQITEAREQIDETIEAAADVVSTRRLAQHFPVPEPSAETESQQPPLQQLKNLAEEAEEQLGELETQPIGQLFAGMRPFWLLGAIWLLVIFPTVGLLGLAWADPLWIVFSGVAAILLTVLILAALYPLARRQAARLFVSLQQIAVDSHAVQQKALKSLDAEFKQRNVSCEQRLTEALAKRNRETETAETTHREKVTAENDRQENDLTAARARFDTLRSEARTRSDTIQNEIEATYPPHLTQLKADFESKTQQLENQRNERVAQTKATRDEQWQALAGAWRGGLADFAQALADIEQYGRSTFPSWSELAGGEWSAPVNVPTSLPIGHFQIDLKEIDGGVPDDARLAPSSTNFSIPILLPFPDRTSIVVRASGEGRSLAVSFLQSVMLRLLVSLPPGRVRFTVIDPVGLGENFSGFMHLADFDELMMSSRIWTESNHIDRRLTDLTEHMENVFQKYLRNEFQTIQEYNEQAGEVAEPYHFLVVANFPVNFSENAARRLLSIAASGPRCGVHTLISVDTKQQLPHNFNLDDIQQNVTLLRCPADQIIWKHPSLGDTQLRPEPSPAPDQLRSIVRKVGFQSKDARRVEVPFRRVVPAEDALWKSDSRAGIDVPLGRAGATSLLHMRLGSGTSQHVLIAGKTGSGKSTMLHVMVTNLALYYRPDEVEFYLIDFKKGVEFKTYASHALPHASVVAIESDREFGLSVLERLDAIMHERGELFRNERAQDVAMYRDRQPDAVMPRILLVIDEFQEFFVEDDRVAQTASLLLDRLIRQGRAFGIHVILGSQTLSGAYTLARSTLGQVAVRIALECSDADAHVILSEENTAARRLSRPGESIYNDASGLLEGNHPFQVAWLPDHERDVYLGRIHQLAEDHQFHSVPPIVFEGNIPADITANPQLAARLEGAEKPTKALRGRAWLGAAVAIKDPVSIDYHRQTASNVMIVGRDADAALGVVSACLYSLASGQQHGNGADSDVARFYILDGSPADSAAADECQQMASALPHCEIAHARTADRLISDIATELSRRQEEDDDRARSIYLFVFNLARFRNLRRGEDEFGFGSTDDKPPGADKLFADIIREGPPLGIHTTIWCDNYNNVDRWLPRRSLSEFDMRVVFQMSSSDSSQLIESPAASKLGAHRALLYREETGTVEKFRPYGPPSAAWLASIKEFLSANLSY